MNTIEPTKRLTLTSGVPDGAPDSYQIVLEGMEFEGADQVYRRSLPLLRKQFPDDQWEVAEKNMLVMTPRLAAALYPCAHVYAPDVVCIG